jgi:MinD-like ATPase involved in chromosome partitioning or flagellar assembly
MVVLKRCVDVDELLATSSAGQADVAVVALDAPGLDPTAVDVLHRHQLRVVAVGSDSDSAHARAARIGVDAWVDHDELDRLTEAIETADAADLDPATAGLAVGEGDRGDPAGLGGAGGAAEVFGGEVSLPTAGPGRLVVVWGPAGAPGRTTVAVSLASVLARRGQSTTLVDADPYGGSVAQHLGVLDEVSGLLGAARFSADGALVERFAAVQRVVADRLTVVTGLPRGERWVEVRPGVVEHLLEVARACGHVVVDTGFSLEEDPAGDIGGRPGRNQLTLGAIDVADELLVVGAADPVGLARLARGLVDLRERRSDVPVRVVVNRMRSGLGWSEREVAGMVEGFARLAGVHFLPDDRSAADRALTTGATIAEAGESELARALITLGDAVVPSSGPRRRRESRWRLAVRRRRAGTGRRR